MRKTKFLKTILCLTLSFSMVMSEYLVADADRSVSTIQKDVNSVKDEIEGLDADLYAVVLLIEEFSEQIEALESEIADTQEALADITAACDAQYASMKIRIQYMYEAQNESMLAMLLGSNSVAEFLNKVEYVNGVYTYDRDKLDQFEAIQLEMQELEAALEIQNEELNAAKANYEAEQQNLQAMLDEKKSELSDLQSELAKAKEKAKKEAERKRKEAAAKRAAERAAREKAAAEKAAAEKAAAEAAAQNANGESSGESNGNENTDNTSSASTESSGASYGEIGGSLNPDQTTGISGGDVVAYASQFVGNPYVWGGTSLTDGADCSGFVQAVYRNFGISWGSRMTSASFRTVGQEVSYDYMQAGDIVCYSGHVGIYMGNGKIVEAQSVRAGITNSRNVDCRTIITIRRVL